MRDFKVFVDNKVEEIIKHLESIGYRNVDSFVNKNYSFIFAKGDGYSLGNTNWYFQESDLPRLTAEEVLALKKEPKFKPYQKVLMRDGDNCLWEAIMFSRMVNKHYQCIGSCTWSQCIPYEGNEHLNGTNKNPE